MDLLIKDEEDLELLSQGRSEKNEGEDWYKEEEDKERFRINRPELGYADLYLNWQVILFLQLVLVHKQDNLVNQTAQSALTNDLVLCAGAVWLTKLSCLCRNSMQNIVKNLLVFSWIVTRRDPFYNYYTFNALPAVLQSASVLTSFKSGAALFLLTCQCSCSKHTST